MTNAEKYAQWLVSNADKKGTPEFDTVAEAYKAARQTEAVGSVASVVAAPSAPQERPLPATSAGSRFDVAMAPLGNVQFPTEMLKSMATRGGPTAVGAGIGALPPLVAATGGLSIPVGGALGGMTGEFLEGMRTGKSPTAGQVAGSAIAGAVLPGASLAKAGGSSLAKQSVASAGVNYAAKATETAIDEGALPSLSETAMAIGTGLLTPYVAKVANSGKYSKAQLETLKKQAYRDETITLARNEGFVVDPALSNPNALNRGVVRVAGQSSLQKQAAIQNQEVLNSIARRELGLAPDEALSTLRMEARKIELTEPYKRVAAISPQAASLVDEMIETRAAARDAWKTYAASAGRDPAAKQAAIAADQAADKAEQGIEAIVKGSSNPSLFDEFKQARVNLAKWHAVEAARNKGDGNIDGTVLGAIYDSAAGKRLTGGLETAARLALAMPQVVKEQAIISSTVDKTFRPIMASMAYAGGHQLAGPAGGVAAAGAVIAGGVPARAMALSPAYQNRMAVPAYGTKTPDALSEFFRYSTAAAGR